MYLMVYAPYGRTGVYMLQEYCRRLGIGTSQEEINDLTAVLKSAACNIIHCWLHSARLEGIPWTPMLWLMHC